MSDSPLLAAIKAVVVDEDGMARTYADRLTALIQNAIRADIDESDIKGLLEVIEVEDPSDEN